MRETKVNSFLNKLQSTRVNPAGEIPDITGISLGDFQVEKRLNIPSGEADIYLCSGKGVSFGKSFILKYYRRENAVKIPVLKKLQEIRNPCVAPLAGYGEHLGHQYAVLPYYRFPALSEALKAGTRFSEEELRQFVIPSVISALKAVHDAGIIHKDLKPANLIPDDAGEHVVLIDFGISSDAGTNTLVVTETGMTPIYAAPEAIQGIFHRESDYYSLGITVFELFTGFTPFQNAGLSAEEAARMASVSRIEFPDGFPPELRKLVLGLTYRDLSHRNEPDNPNRRWGYNEVERWLRREDLPVPGELSGGEFAGAMPSFPPYGFAGTRYTEISALVRAMLMHPEAGLRELGRGILTHHFGLCDAAREQLCLEAENDLQKSPDIIGEYGVFYRLMYRLSPDTAALFCGGREFRDFRELGDMAVSAAIKCSQSFQSPAKQVTKGDVKTETNDDTGISPQDSFTKELRLMLRSGFLDFYAEEILKSQTVRDILVRISDAISRQETAGKEKAARGERPNNNAVPDNLRLNLEAAWIFGYGFSERREICFHGKVFPDAAALSRHFKTLEADSGFPAYMSYAEEGRQDLEFFAAVYPDEAGRESLKKVLTDLNRAVFGEGEYQFRNARAFEDYISLLVSENRPYEARFILNTYGDALKAVSHEVWKTDSYEVLKQTVSGFVSFDEHLFTSLAALRDYLSGLLEKYQRVPEFFRAFIEVHERPLKRYLKHPDLAEIVNRILALGNVGKDTEPENLQKGITVSGVRYPIVKPLASGDYMRFGCYVQEDGINRTPLEWLVLDVSGNEALMISRYALASRKFHRRSIAVSWKDCELRKWLNGPFLEETFSAEERSRISVSRLSNDGNPEYGTSGGAETQDRIFCLSIAEAQRYFPNDAARKCQPMDSAVTHDSFISDGCCYWWLRSPGYNSLRAAIVSSDGKPGLYGVGVNGSPGGVRPALRMLLKV
ncbi:protein kinase domain-containing protein [Succinimonas sp.]|uniref:protein kinase domain-containing protein n=1 Tax=Succinimonas sp. TaxID=1936151 RepID=UPI003863F898